MTHFPPGIDFRDVSEQLTELYNQFACHSDEFPILDEDWVYQTIKDTFDDSDIELLLHDDFGKGIVMGRLALLATWNEMQDAADEREREDERP